MSSSTVICGNTRGVAAIHDVRVWRPSHWTGPSVLVGKVSGDFCSIRLRCEAERVHFIPLLIVLLALTFFRLCSAVSHSCITYSSCKTFVECLHYCLLVHIRIARGNSCFIL